MNIKLFLSVPFSRATFINMDADSDHGFISLWTSQTPRFYSFQFFLSYTRGESHIRIYEVGHQKLVAGAEILKNKTESISSCAYLCLKDARQCVSFSYSPTTRECILSSKTPAIESTQHV